MTDRSEILAKAINALEAATHSGVSTTGGMAKAVTDAVLSAVADDLDALAQANTNPFPGTNPQVGYAGGIRRSADRVRALIEEGQDQ